MVWIRAWAGGVSAAMIIAMGVIVSDKLIMHEIELKRRYFAQIFSMIIASKLIRFFKGQMPVALSENYDIKPLPPVPPHSSTVVTFGSTTTKEVPRTLRKEMSLDPHVPTPPRSRRHLSRKATAGTTTQQPMQQQTYTRYVTTATAPPAAAQTNHYMPSPPSKPRKIDERVQVRRLTVCLNMICQSVKHILLLLNSGKPRQQHLRRPDRPPHPTTERDTSGRAAAVPSGPGSRPSSRRSTG